MPEHLLTFLLSSHRVMPHQTCQKSEQSCSYHLVEAIPFDSMLLFDSLVAQIPIHILYGETKPGRELAMWSAVRADSCIKSIILNIKYPPLTDHYSSGYPEYSGHPGRHAAGPLTLISVLHATRAFYGHPSPLILWPPQPSFICRLCILWPPEPILHAAQALYGHLCLLVCHLCIS
ncbi:hypothetical protein PAXRUDRAFT_353271 [Paxillus rubicundulus Ve08.2h10]|uniref:Uncharacterized protein n=1 Tax=Paxillus rubicundulus Ve08.2h10 TaxID=930991 RepID=A0A0D0CRG1_9AGAM|nr:hypothetical protein PAXRUDRAFT_353271 [Paxillus rubicundulus Ve08.2h10]